MSTLPLVLLVVAAVALGCPPARGAGPAPRGTGERWPVVLLAGTVVALALGAPRWVAPALVLGGAAWAAHRLWVVRLRTQAAAATRDRVLECCDLVTAELTAGQDAAMAMARAAEAWPTLAPVAQTLAYGGDVPAALRRVADGPGAGGLALVAAAWQVAHRTGAGLADALSRVAASLREERATDRVVRGELASARATARLVALLPLFALAVGTGSGGRPVDFLLGTPLGLVCLAGGLALGLAGLAWIERIAAEVGR